MGVDQGYCATQAVEPAVDFVKPQKDPLPVAKVEAKNWDLETQQPHGGQEWSTISNFVDDFSVTTNFLGPPMKAVAACGTAIHEIEHYPPANFEPYLSELAAWIQPDDYKELHSRLMLGNGASELIDLCIRIGAHQGPFAVKSDAQYKEYERAALADGREKVAPTSGKFGLLAVINPCNPTGEYLPVEDMKKYIERTCKPSTTVLVDESMQLWRGPEWRSDSLVSQRDWVRQMYEEKDIRVYIMHSWTKIWTCPGIRLGSLICPHPKFKSEMLKHQVPWSLNVFALRFLSACIKDAYFMKQTWEACPRLRARTMETLTEMFPDWEFHGEPWLSWLWIDTKDKDVAARAVEVAKKAGVSVGGVQNCIIWGNHSSTQFPDVSHGTCNGMYINKEGGVSTSYAASKKWRINWVAVE